MNGERNPHTGHVALMRNMPQNMPTIVIVEITLGQYTLHADESIFRNFGRYTAR
eukprot:CAMPEP_0195519814 /NCGR_PEP_ID=MMETSP0794_2-20130614/15563_1 /TAXON_ID=515487 /ORGANISM="Stephanopyxis turris, Strain CCMP 815" /LENGTH=53 /DNA_ID=CAMNT_0040649037 /DNA_START=569 /DNA_END=730 /DNA_ORIENTATION=+